MIHEKGVPLLVSTYLFICATRLADMEEEGLSHTVTSDTQKGFKTFQGQMRLPMPRESTPGYMV